MNIENIKIIWSTRLKTTLIKLIGNDKIVLNANKIEKDDANDIIKEFLASPNLLKDINSNIWLKSEKKIGQGGFALVYNCKNNKNIVIKKGDSKILENEIKIYQSFKSFEKIPTFFAFGTDFIVLEKFKFVLSQILSTINIEFKIYICKQLIDSLQFIHDNDILHCDIKPTNILLSAKTIPCKIVFTDFGLARPINTKEKSLINRFGTRHYMSTDVHAKRYPTKKSDLESLGFVFHEMLIGKLPWHDKNGLDDINNSKITFLENTNFEYLKNISDTPNYNHLKSFI
jgi:serine/threonine protein kinase